jgi:hypothetical protein
MTVGRWTFACPGSLTCGPDDQDPDTFLLMDRAFAMRITPEESGATTIDQNLPLDAASAPHTDEVVNGLTLRLFDLGFDAETREYNSAGGILSPGEEILRVSIASVGGDERPRGVEILRTLEFDEAAGIETNY